MARIAFEVDAEENLRGILRRLQRRRLRCAHGSAPVDSNQEALGVAGRGGIQKLPHHLVIRLVLFERVEQPWRDALTLRNLGDVSHAFIVAQQIVPIADPMLGVARRVVEQRCHQLAALVGIGARDERPGLFRRGKQSPDIEIGPAREFGGIDGNRLGDALLREVRGSKAVERIRPAGPSYVRNRGLDQLQRRFPTCLCDRGC